MAAATLLESAPEAEIFLIERNDGLGKKVIISGGGRCNVTTGITDVRTVLTKYPRGNKFLSSAIYGFPPEAVYAWFEDHGVPLKTEDDLRVFPQSNNGKDIVRVFELLFERSGVRVMLKTDVSAIKRGSDGGFVVCFKGTLETLEVDTVVLTTGGQAYRHTGSTGDGYAFAVSLGHTLTPLAPSLNAFFTRERWPADVSGLSFHRVTITAKRGKGISFTGPMLFTHRGVSGPAVFALSSLVAFEKYDSTTPLEISIDLFPDKTSDELVAEMEQFIIINPGKIFRNVLGLMVSKSLVDVAIVEAGLPGDKKVAEVSKQDMRKAAAWLKGIPLQAIQRGGGDEFVTAGGVPLTEIDPGTMESTVCPGLYFGGEVMDVDGFTGGFNLQASWATGRRAGESIAEKANSR